MITMCVSNNKKSYVTRDTVTNDNKKTFGIHVAKFWAYMVSSQTKSELATGINNNLFYYENGVDWRAKDILFWGQRPDRDYSHNCHPETELGNQFFSNLADFEKDTLKQVAKNLSRPGSHITY